MSSALIRRGQVDLQRLGRATRTVTTTEEGSDRITALPSGDAANSAARSTDRRAERRRLRRRGSIMPATTAPRTSTSAFRSDRFDADAEQRCVSRSAARSRRPADPAITTADDYELGGDVTRPLAGGGLKLIGLATRRTATTATCRCYASHSDVIGGFAQNLDDRLRRDAWCGWSGTASDLARLERRDRGRGRAQHARPAEVDLFSLGAGGAATRIDLPVDQAVVKECARRGVRQRRASAVADAAARPGADVRSVAT